MTGPLPIRLVLLAPRAGSSGPGDYVEDLLRVVAGDVAELHVLRHGGPGEDGVADIRRLRRRLRDVVAKPCPLPTVVHLELSGGVIAGLWATAGLRGVTLTGTLHDPPRAVWFPARTRLVARSRVANGVLHKLPHRPWRRVEARLLRDARLLALTPAGAAAVSTLGDLPAATVGVHVPPEAAPVPPAAERPLAVGLFGYRYGGKGYDELQQLRAMVPPDVAIRVAGRGTETLAPIDGVDILGPVDGPALTAYFASIRVLLLPYDRRRIGGVEPVQSSATQLLALAHHTPVVATRTIAAEAQRDTGALAGVADDLTGLAGQAVLLARDPDALRSAVEQADRHVAAATDEAVRRAYRQLWSPA